MDTVGQRIGTARKAVGLSQDGLADRVGVSVRTVSRWETGTRYPRSDDLRAIADALGKPVSYFLADDEPAGADTSPKTIRLTIDGQTFEGTPEQIAELSARLTPRDTNTEPGVAALLADEALCSKLGVTPAQAHALAMVRAGGQIQTVQQALSLLDALR